MTQEAEHDFGPQTWLHTAFFQRTGLPDVKSTRPAKQSRTPHAVCDISFALLFAQGSLGSKAANASSLIIFASKILLPFVTSSMM